VLKSPDRRVPSRSASIGHGWTLLSAFLYCATGRTDYRTMGSSTSANAGGHGHAAHHGATRRKTGTWNTGHEAARPPQTGGQLWGRARPRSRLRWNRGKRGAHAWPNLVAATITLHSRPSPLRHNSSRPRPREAYHGSAARASTRSHRRQGRLLNYPIHLRPCHSKGVPWRRDALDVWACG
jgi:hypothetical protein